MIYINELKSRFVVGYVKNMDAAISVTTSTK